MCIYKHIYIRKPCCKVSGEHRQEQLLGTQQGSNPSTSTIQLPTKRQEIPGHEPIVHPSVRSNRAPASAPRLAPRSAHGRQRLLTRRPIRSPPPIQRCSHQRRAGVQRLHATDMSGSHNALQPECVHSLPRTSLESSGGCIAPSRSTSRALRGENASKDAVRQQTENGHEECTACQASIGT